MAYRTYNTVNGFIVAQNGTGDFTSINAAITAINAASPSISQPTIYLADTSYNENIILPNQCLITTLSSGAYRAGVSFSGKMTLPSGIATVSNIRFNNSNGDYSIVSGGELRLNECNFIASTFDIIQTTGSGFVAVTNGTINLFAINLSYFQLSGSSSSSFQNVIFENLASSTKASLTTNSLVTLNCCTCFGVFQSIGSGYYNIDNCYLNCSSINSTPLISGGAGDVVSSAILNGGSSPALSISSNCNITTSTLNSSGSNVISGSGTLIYGDLTFTGSTTIANTITKTPLTTLIGTLNLNPITFLTGSLPYATSAGVISPLIPATNGDVLQLQAGVPVWSTISPSPITITGDSGSSISGSSLTFTTGQSTLLNGSSVFFSGDGSTTMTLNLTDPSYNVIIGNGSGFTSYTGEGGNTVLGVFSFTVDGSAGPKNNTVIGNSCFTDSGFTGYDNVALGRSALAVITGANIGNTAIGSAALAQIATGQTNTALGYNAGFNYTTTETQNILVGHEGVLGESNVMRLGTPSPGSDAGQINETFVAGIVGNTVVGNPVYVDSNGQLGDSSSLPQNVNFVYPNFDYLSTTPSTIYTPPVGYNFFPTSCYCYFTTIVDWSGNDSVGVGSAADSYGYIGFSPSFNNTSNFATFTLNNTNSDSFITNSNPLGAVASGGFSATTLIGTIVGTGILVPQ